MLLCFLWQIAATALFVSAATPTESVRKRSSHIDNSRSRFVFTKDGRFFFNGRCVQNNISYSSILADKSDSVLNFVGTNAYWLAALNTEEDIDFTLGNMSAKGIKVVSSQDMGVQWSEIPTVP